MPPRVQLWQKIEAARNAAKAVERKGKHHGTEDDRKYRFARAEDAFIEGRRVFTEQRLIVLPGVPSTSRSWSESVGLVLEVEMSFEVIDVETGESVKLPWVGYGHDKPGDKAIGKGITGARKYFLAALLEIPFVGIDPEQDEAAVPSSSRRESTPAERANAGAEAARRKHQQDRDAEQSDPPAPEPVDEAPTEAKEPARVAG